MLVVHVHVHVKPELVDAFKAATVENARASIQEPGIARFDIIQQTDDPTVPFWSRSTTRRTTQAGTRRRRTTPSGATRCADDGLSREQREVRQRLPRRRRLVTVAQAAGLRQSGGLRYSPAFD